MKKTESLLPTKAKGIAPNINEKSQTLLTKIIRDDPFVTCDRLRVRLHKVDVNVCKQTVISSLKRIEHGSYFAAHKTRIDRRAHEEKIALGAI